MGGVRLYTDPPPSREGGGCKKERGALNLWHCDLTIQPQTPPPFRANPTLKSRFWGRCLAVFARFRPFSAKFGQKRPKATRNRLLLKGSFRVLGAGGGGVCGWKAGHNSGTWRGIKTCPSLHPLRCLVARNLGGGGGIIHA